MGPIGLTPQNPHTASSAPPDAPPPDHQQLQRTHPQVAAIISAPRPDFSDPRFSGGGMSAIAAGLNRIIYSRSFTTSKLKFRDPYVTFLEIALNFFYLNAMPSQS